MHDLLIRGATVVDGTGAQPVTADVAVNDGRITEVSLVTGNAPVLFLLTGLICCPVMSISIPIMTAILAGVNP